MFEQLILLFRHSQMFTEEHRGGGDGGEAAARLCNRICQNASNDRNTKSGGRQAGELEFIYGWMRESA